MFRTMCEECESFFKDLSVNRTMRRRFTGKGGDQVQILGNKWQQHESQVFLSKIPCALLASNACNM